MKKLAIQNPDVQLLAKLASSLKEGYAKDEVAWENSPFGWIRTRQSRQKGVIGEHLVAGYFAAQGFDVMKSPDTQADRIIGGIRTEIKFSLLWKNGIYKFQQLRDQNYRLAVCLGISPFDAHCWVIPKALLMEKRDSLEGLSNQHGGKSGQDTMWLSVTPTNVQKWLSPLGGTLANATRVFAQLTKG